MIDDKPDTTVIHVSANDILKHANHGLINIRLDYKNNGVNEVLISCILVKKNPNLTAIVRRFNNMLRDLSEKNGFSLFVTILLQLIIYGKMVFTCRTWEPIF